MTAFHKGNIGHVPILLILLVLTAPPAGFADTPPGEPKVYYTAHVAVRYYNDADFEALERSFRPGPSGAAGTYGPESEFLKKEIDSLLVSVCESSGAGTEGLYIDLHLAAPEKGCPDYAGRARDVLAGRAYYFDAGEAALYIDPYSGVQDALRLGLTDAVVRASYGRGLPAGMPELIGCSAMRAVSAAGAGREITY